MFLIRRIRMELDFRHSRYTLCSMAYAMLDDTHFDFGLEGRHYNSKGASAIDGNYLGNLERIRELEAQGRSERWRTSRFRR
jgi:hypothetical protein